jgi:anti-sigma-K factor RskA
MTEPFSRRPDAQDDPDLRMQALLYVFGELDEAATHRFEERLAEDQAVREALLSAVQRCHELAGLTPRGPNPAYRQRVRAQLRASRKPASAPEVPRSERAKPVVWVLTGAAATVLVLALGTFAPGRVSPAPATPTLQKVAESSLPKALNEAGEDCEPPLEQLAEGWATVPQGQHLARLLEEERRRREEDHPFVPSQERINRLLRPH